MAKTSNDLITNSASVQEEITESPPGLDGQWTWVDGSNTIDQSGTYGTEDIPDAANVPGARSSFASWTDNAGKLWLFGGWGYDSVGNAGRLNDLWKFDPATEQWTWVDGSNIVDQSGIYGTEDISDAANVPGGRSAFVSWTDSAGKLWLFGGSGYDSLGNHRLLNDLWKFDPASGQWTWVDGSNTGSESGTYGTEDTPSSANVPGARNRSVSWTDSAGKLWLFGGQGWDSTGYTISWLNDLWKFDPATGQWTWVDGSNTVDQFGIYGTEDTPDAANVPGARNRSVSWIDSAGKLWLFGGEGYDSAGATGDLNDLWKFDPTTGQWTWIDGSNTVDHSGIYGTEDTPSASNVPGGRYNSAPWIDNSGELWLFGGTGFDSTGTTGNLNDLWKFDPATGQWTWVDGANTVNQSGTYGTEDTPSVSNVPGARGSGNPVSWIDNAENLWLFGGSGYDSAGSWGWLNDLWKYGEIVSNPKIVAQYPDNLVTGRDWTYGTSVTLEIDDPSNGVGVDYTDTQTVGWAPFNPSLTYVEFDLGSFPLESGLLLSMTDGVTTKELTTTNLAVASVNHTSDVVTGTSDPGVDVGVYILPGGTYGRNETADGSGNWSADFSVPGDEGWESATYDIQPGDFGMASIQDNDADETRYYWDVPYQIILKSQAKYDGWVLESSETSGKGGTKNNRSKVFYVGDDAYNRQYRSILSFNTAGIPDDAEITNVTLKIKKAGLVGTNPFKTHSGLFTDVRKGKFGTSLKLQLSDFQAKASKNKVGRFKKASSGWYKAVLGSTAYPYIKLDGTTQFRVRFAKDDNNDFGPDYMKFYSGNAGTSSRPQLIVEYTIP